jgi:predicted Zn-dependent protease
MVFGPFVNDAISNVFRVGSSEIKNIHETCSSQIMEVEADLVGLRLLALAGFNPFDAQRFWSPVHPPTPSHVSTTLTNKPVPPGRWRAAIDAAGGRKSHPEDEARVQAVRRELERWREEWRKLGERTAKMAA